jgi:ribonucleotide reductase beta subunit family protein with ferritin-like domain
MDVSYFSGFNNAVGMETSPAVSSSMSSSVSLAVNTANTVNAEKWVEVEVESAKAAKVDEVEPILRENPNRFTLFPIQKPKLYRHYKNHLSTFWVAEEVDLTKDMKDWVKLTTNEQYFIKNILGFFAGSDGIVQENLASRFMKEIQLPEARNYYSVQLMMEAIHSEMYSLLIDTYIEDKAEKTMLFQATQTIPCVKQKAEWAQKWIESTDEDFATRLVAFAVVEGIFFSGSFCAIYWLKERGLMPGLTTSNEFIARDEGLHTDFACALFEEIERKPTKAKIHKMIREAVKIEKQFITESLPCRLVGMNDELMARYIEFVADRLSTQLGYGKLFSAANPFDFMERISLEGKDNFFEKRVTTYAKAGVGKKQDEMTFSLDAEF